MITLITLLLFIGATGKSAQIPLFVWLPDAMAGPTPVSALIHAATMVTAGRLYDRAAAFPLRPGASDLVANRLDRRSNRPFSLPPLALTQNDIKKVLAYSTVSQLGYMFLAVGIGAFSAAIFHFFTHAFFKACLFLGSGSVIHALGGEQDMRKMGGLKARMPTTYWTYVIATLAIAGAPFTAGFFLQGSDPVAGLQSRRALWSGRSASHRGHDGLLYVPPAVHGFSRRVPSQTIMPKRIFTNRRAIMTVPLVILAAGSIFAGWLGRRNISGAASGINGCNRFSAAQERITDRWPTEINVTLA